MYVCMDHGCTCTCVCVHVCMFFYAPHPLIDQNDTVCLTTCICTCMYIAYVTQKYNYIDSTPLKQS